MARGPRALAAPPPADATGASIRNTWVLVGFTAVTNLADGVIKVALPMLYGGGLALGVAEVIALTSAAAIVVDAVAPAGRERANAWVTAAETLCNEFAGPSLGGLLVAAGAAVALGSTAGAYLLAMVILLLLVGRFRVVPDPDRARPSVHRQIGEGLRFLWRERLLRTLALTVTQLVTCWAAWFALMPLVAANELGLRPERYGALVAALGVGGLLGTLCVRTVNRLIGRRWAMSANVFLTAAMVAAPALTANVWAIGAGALLGGLGGTLWVVNSRSISQLLVGAEMMGRYNGAARLLSWGVLPLGALVAGGLAQWLGVHLAFGVFAVATLASIAPLLRTYTPAVAARIDAKLAGGVHGSSKAAR